MGLHNLKPAVGAYKNAKRKGRGPASGNGKTAGTGHKGRKARSGGTVPVGFEGGQTPMYRRLPKRGFRNTRFETTWQIVNLVDLEGIAADQVVDHAFLVESGRLKLDRAAAGLKVLANGELSTGLTIKAMKFSKSALAKIEAAGGTAEVI
jgi:large subunit ribosomal protein L15